MTKTVKAWASRFNIKVRYPLNNVGCHEWVGGKDPRGYGRFWLDGKTLGAHVAAYILYRGEMPRGLTIDHLCKNPSCVRIDHLEAVTHEVNVLRSDNPMAKNARKTQCKNGHKFVPQNTYVFVKKSSGREFRQCKICWNKKRAEQMRRAKLTYEAPIN